MGSPASHKGLIQREVTSVLRGREGKEEEQSLLASPGGGGGGDSMQAARNREVGTAACVVCVWGVLG